MSPPHRRHGSPVQTHHRLVHADSPQAASLEAGTVHLVVTSPPYPMISMWDDSFAAQSPAAAAALTAEDGPTAFEAMHTVLDGVWQACAEALTPGGIACINIADATRTLAGEFQLYPNHARAIVGLQRAGLQLLPDIIWRKPTNAPNKFMGSGMLPAGAYVTYEHEYILIARKGGRRRFRSAADRERRRRSAFFWEERNVWFSDLWHGLQGARQALPVDGPTRKRSGAFPVALPLRLIDMYSLQGDTVLDPFAGTGTTALAAAASGRDSISIERETSLAPLIAAQLAHAPVLSAARSRRRLADHRAFVDARTTAGKPPKHHNGPHDVPVVTRQETALALPTAQQIHAIAPGRWQADTQVGP